MIWLPRAVTRLAAVLVVVAVALGCGSGGEAQNLVRTHDQVCACDPADPESMAARQCSLCREAERQPADMLYFFLKDSNPRKPNRWLILPRAHAAGMHSLADLSPADAAKFWTAAAAKGESMWQSQWGLAINGDRSRTQCHAHVHIGKLVDGAEGESFLFGIGGSPAPGKPVIVLQDISQVQAPRGGEGFWIHAAGSVIHMHMEDPSAASEFVLAR